jgi:UDPglucose 6-dehydrogenase
MKVSIIGTGYVGLTTGVALAYLGHQVTCVDIDEAKVEGLNRGIAPIYEPGLEELMARCRSSLTFTCSYREAVRDVDAIFIAVGTPASADGSPNLDYLFQAVAEVLDWLEDKQSPTLLVNKSTVPVGTADRIMERIRARKLDSLVEVASNPEFLRQGRALQDTLRPERIVAGGSDYAAEVLRTIYKPILESSDAAFIHVGLRSAELAKYAANAYLAMKISFINEMANVCDRVEADVAEIAHIIGTDGRIGPSFLHAGIGYGGSCFPKDTRALRYIADTNGYDFKLLSAVIEVNNGQRNVMLDKLRKQVGELSGKRIAVLGLTFKPLTDDLRDAPSLPIIEALVAEGAEVWVHDPLAMEKARGLLPDSVSYGLTARETLLQADAALLVTEWEDYLELQPEEWRSLMRRALVIDGRNALPALVRQAIEYHGIGVQPVGSRQESVMVH